MHSSGGGQSQTPLAIHSLLLYYFDVYSMIFAVSKKKKNQKNYELNILYVYLYVFIYCWCMYILYVYHMSTVHIIVHIMLQLAGNI